MAKRKNPVAAPVEAAPVEVTEVTLAEFEAAKVAPVETAPVETAPVETAYFKAAGRLFASAARSQGMRLAEFGEHLRGADYARWEAARAAFETGAREAEYADPGSLWKRTLAAARELGFVGEKPAAPSAAATKKASTRAKAKAKADAIAAGKTPAELLTEGRKALDDGDASRAAELIAAAKRAREAADKAAREASAEAVKAAMDRIRAACNALAKAGNAKALTAIATNAERVASGAK